MSDERSKHDSLDERIRPLRENLAAGGPPVDYAALHLYIARSLSPADIELVRQHIVTWQAWHDAYWEIQTAIAIGEQSDSQAVPADSAIANRFDELFRQISTPLSLPSEQEIECLSILAGSKGVGFRSMYDRIRERRTAVGQPVPAMTEVSSWLRLGVASGVFREEIATAGENEPTHLPGVRDASPTIRQYQLAGSAEELFVRFCRSVDVTSGVTRATRERLDDLADALGLSEQWLAAFEQTTRRQAGEPP